MGATSASTGPIGRDRGKTDAPGVTLASQVLEEAPPDHLADLRLAVGDEVLGQAADEATPELGVGPLRLPRPGVSRADESDAALQEDTRIGPGGRTTGDLPHRLDHGVV